MASSILDKHGIPYPSLKRGTGPKAINLLYNHPYSVYHSGDFRYRPFVTGDTDKVVSGASRMQYVNWSRQLFAQMAILDFGMEMVCDWAVGEHYDIIYRGNDKQFGSQLEDWCNNTWANSCNVLGTPSYNFRNTLKQIIREKFRDGDILQLYTYNRSRFPQLQYVRTHRVIERNGITEIKDGRFAGYKVSDGVVKNSAGYAIGYYIQDPTNENDDYVVSTKDATLIFDCKYFDKPRGLPGLMPAILDAWSTQELDDAIQRRVKLETTLGFQHYNQYGEAPPDQAIPMFPTEQDEGVGLPSIVNPPQAPPAIQPIIGGLQYLQSGKEEYKTLSTNMPHEELILFKYDLEQHCLSLLGVPHQLLFSTKDISRAPARGISEIFRKTVAKTQHGLDTFITPAVVWAVGNAIQDGFISPPANDEKWWNNIEFTRPAEFTLDAYNDAKQQMDFYRLGLTTRDEITTSRSGRRGNDIVTARTSEVINLWSAAVDAKKALDAKYATDATAKEYVKDVSVTTLYNSLEQRTANPLPEPDHNEPAKGANETE